MCIKKSTCDVFPYLIHIHKSQDMFLNTDFVLSLAFITAESRLMVYENRVLTRIFGAKRDEVTGEWRRL